MSLSSWHSAVLRYKIQDLALLQKRQLLKKEGESMLGRRQSRAEGILTTVIRASVCYLALNNNCIQTTNTHRLRGVKKRQFCESMPK